MALRLKPIQEFLQLESAGGIVLIAVLIAVIIIANTPLNAAYEKILNIPIHIRFSTIYLEKPLKIWVNDGLMALFFMLLTLEIKRETLEGELSKFSQAILPSIAALGGILIPAFVYLVIIHPEPGAAGGWPIPTTTDVALTLGIASILGRKIVPVGLRVFLVALSIVDDLVAIIIIAILYTSDLSVTALIVAGIGFLILIIMNLSGITRISLYIMVGIVVWVAVVKSGVHATLAGTMVGICVPLRTRRVEERRSPLRHLEHTLHPWIAFFVIPLFVFCNAGIPFGDTTFQSLTAPLPLAIMMGLFFGKQIGIFCFTWVSVKMGLGKLPSESNWLQLYGISILAGIGFTMSLFLSTLTFEGTIYETASRQGVIIGSLISTIAGVFILIMARKLIERKQLAP